ncbi:hypothetical protein Q5O89_18975 [Peribacillus frigoritolerans]|nr:hypothetical protein [Peribacillus frigoritolerans]
MDGLNRKPGLIRNCGGVGGDTTTERAKHDFTCKDESELIQYTSVFGEKTESGDGMEVVVNQAGVVAEIRNKRGETFQAVVLFLRERGRRQSGFVTMPDKE